MIRGSYTIFFDSNCGNHRVLFGTEDRLSDTSPSTNRPGIRIYSDHNFWDKILLILNNFFLNNIITFSDNDGKKLHLNLNSLRAWIWRHQGCSLHSKDDLVIAINSISDELIFKDAQEAELQKPSEFIYPLNFENNSKTAPKRHLECTNEHEIYELAKQQLPEFLQFCTLEEKKKAQALAMSYQLRQQTSTGLEEKEKNGILADRFKQKANEIESKKTFFPFQYDNAVFEQADLIRAAKQEELPETFYSSSSLEFDEEKPMDAVYPTGRATYFDLQKDDTDSKKTVQCAFLNLENVGTIVNDKALDTVSYYFQHLADKFTVENFDFSTKDGAASFMQHLHNEMLNQLFTNLGYDSILFTNQGKPAICIYKMAKVHLKIVDEF